MSGPAYMGAMVAGVKFSRAATSAEHLMEGRQILAALAVLDYLHEKGWAACLSNTDGEWRLIVSPKVAGPDNPVDIRARHAVEALMLLSGHLAKGVMASMGN